MSRATRDGYLAPAIRSWAVALCRSNEAAFDDFVAKSGPVFAHILKPSHAREVPPGAFVADAPVSDPERAICEQLGLKPGSLKD